MLLFLFYFIALGFALSRFPGLAYPALDKLNALSAANGDRGLLLL